jgi:hypothetical protein
MALFAPSQSGVGHRHPPSSIGARLIFSAHLIDDGDKTRGAFPPTAGIRGRPRALTRVTDSRADIAQQACIDSKWQCRK